MTDNSAPWFSIMPLHSDFSFAYGDKLELCGHVYRLHSVVVHEGTADAGHYYCYIHPTCNKKVCQYYEMSKRI